MPDPLFDVTFVTRPQPRLGGDYLHRTYWPAAALGEHLPTTSIQLSHPDCLEAMATARLLCVTMVMDADLTRVFEERRRRGLPTIYEISDDFEAFPENLPLCRFYAQPWVRQLARELCQKADAVQFSSPALARKYGHLNPVHRVFHNQAWDLPGEPRAIDPASTATLRVGWAGMAGHYEDCEDLAEFLAPSFGKRASKPFNTKHISLTLMTTPRIAQALSNAKLTFSWQPTGSMLDYCRFLDGIDVGIAHSSNNDFSLSRSDGKFIEYATRGVVPVCSKRGTYAETIRHDETGVLYASPAQLRAELSRLKEAPELRRRLSATVQDELRRSRNHHVAALNRLEFYQAVVARAARDFPNAPRQVSRFAPAQGFSQLVHETEEALQSAMMQDRNDSASPELLQTYWQLAQRAPDFYRIWERMLEVYRQLGLTENLPALQKRAKETKDKAFERAFGSVPAHTSA
jgi:hypothetical protein